ncbi:hypothetical protein MAHJHV60_45450 [Mycobacterium avium subsp. hominissuis]
MHRDGQGARQRRDEVGAVHRLLCWGIVATPLIVVPAPTRRSAARRRVLA